MNNKIHLYHAKSCIKTKRRRDRWCSAPPTPPASLLLHLADHVSRDGRVEVDGVVAETLRCFVTLPTPALEGFAHLYLGSVAVLGVILDPVDILQ